MNAQWAQPSGNQQAIEQIVREAQDVRFQMARRDGYEAESVDDFLDQKIKVGKTGGEVGPLLAQARFNTSRRQPGYACRTVDELLDRWLRLTDAHRSS